MECSEANRWHGEPLGQKKLLVLAPKSYGDVFERSRHLWLLTDDWKVVLPEEVLPLFERVFSNAHLAVYAQPLPSFDVWTDLMDGLALALKETHRPKATRFVASESAIAKYLGLKPQCGNLVGLCWRATQREAKSDWEKWRLLRPGEIAKLAAIPNVTWVNLQYGEKLPVPSLNPAFETWDDTAGLIHNLDAVVSVDTAVAHLAAGMGKSTFILHGVAPTSVVTYTDFTAMYPGNVKEFKPDYGGSHPLRAEDKLIRFVQERHPAIWRLAGKV